LSVHNPCLSGGTLEIFLDPVVPPPLVQVLGDGPVATALVGLAERLDYSVSAVDRQTINGALGVIVASHGRDEVETLTAALDAGVPYIGLVASRRRAAGVLNELVEARPDLARIAPGRVHSPAGLDIGARTAAEIALSILAEVVSTRVHSAAPDQPPHGDHAFAREAADVAAAGRPNNGHPTTAIDPVCGMTVAAVETSLHLDHEGNRFYFCGPGCLRAFSANPGMAPGVEPAAPDEQHAGMVGAAGYPES
jgi:xanthine dehydrogenase accessory factor